MSYFDHFVKENPNHGPDGRFASADSSGGEAKSVSMIKVGEKKGTNPGGLHMDENMKQHYVKFYANPDQARVEELSSKLFGLMGCHNPQPKFMTVNDQPALVTAWNPDLKQLSESEFGKLNLKQQDQIGRMYMAAVLTKNWDVAGLEADNIVLNTKTGDMVEVDTGGSMHFRAQGAPKPYGGDIAELQSLRNPDNASGRIFNKEFQQNPSAEKDAVKWVKNLPMGQVEKDFAASGLPNQKALFATFKARRTALLAHYSN